MDIINLKVGPIQTNCYIVVDDGEALVVDPGAQGSTIAACLAELDGVKLRSVVLTHGHWDHIGGIPGVLVGSDARLLCHRDDAYRLFDQRNLSKLARDVATRFADGKVAGVEVESLEDGDAVAVGSKVFCVIHTPGHTEGSICLHCPEEGVLFAGDTLFAGGRFGRVDFAGGSMDAMVKSLSTKFAAVDDDTVVFSGHEGNSTMLRERELNPYLR